MFISILDATACGGGGGPMQGGLYTIKLFSQHLIVETSIAIRLEGLHFTLCYCNVIKKAFPCDHVIAVSLAPSDIADTIMCAHGLAD